MIIEDAIWYKEVGSTKPIGIISAFDETTKARKFYIGTGDGNSEQDDAQKILELGAKFHVEDIIKMKERS